MTGHGRFQQQDHLLTPTDDNSQDNHLAFTGQYLVDLGNTLELEIFPTNMPSTAVSGLGYHNVGRRIQIGPRNSQLIDDRIVP